MILPKDRHAIGDQKLLKNHRWSDATEAVPEVMALATPVAVEWVPSEREFNPVESFKFTAERGRYLLATVRRGLVGFGGYKLNRVFAQVVAVPDFPCWAGGKAGGLETNHGGFAARSRGQRSGSAVR